MCAIECSSVDQFIDLDGDFSLVRRTRSLHVLDRWMAADSDLSGQWVDRVTDGVPVRASGMKRLYVGNLKYSMTSDDLQRLFEPFGEIRSAQVLIDRETNRSRGFGFVEMTNDPEALTAIESLDGTDYDGRRLTVNEARPRTPGGDSAFRNGGRGGGGSRSGGGQGYGRHY